MPKPLTPEEEEHRTGSGTEKIDRRQKYAAFCADFYPDGFLRLPDGLLGHEIGKLRAPEAFRTIFRALQASSRSNAGNGTTTKHRKTAATISRARTR